ncbi:hypothetical protein GCM10028774_64530 [Spirosoma jeollabukense]
MWYVNGTPAVAVRLMGVGAITVMRMGTQALCACPFDMFDALMVRFITPVAVGVPLMEGGYVS